MSKSLVERYEQVLAQDPASTVFVELAKALIESGQHSRAIEVCQGGLQHHPNSVVGRVLWGKALIQLGKPSEAMGQFDTAVNIDKDNPHAYNLIGEVLLHKGLYRSALPILRKAAVLQPNDGRIRQWLEQTRAALAGGPAPVLTDSSALAPSSAPADDPQATALLDPPPDANSLPTVVTQAYTPGIEDTRSMRGPPGRGADGMPLGVGDMPTQAEGHKLRPRDAAYDPSTLTADEMGGQVPGRSSPTQVLQSPNDGSPPPPPTMGDDDPFANVPKRQDEGDLLAGFTSTFNALAEGNDRPGIPMPPGGDPFDQFPSPPTERVMKGGSIGSEPSVMVSGGLLADVPSEEVSVPQRAQAPAPRAAPRPNDGRPRGLLDDIPDVHEHSSQIEVPKVEMSTTATEAIAKEYERELREKFAASTRKKTFLQAHGFKLAMGLAMLVALGGGGAGYFYTLSRNRGLDLASAVAEGRKALNVDGPLKYREGVKVLELAQSMDSDNAEVHALLGYAHAMLYDQAGHAPEELQAAKQALAFPGAKEKAPELALVADLMIADGAGAAAARSAVLTSQLEKAEVHAEAGRLLLADKKHDEALKRLTRAIELMPTHVRGLVTLGNYYLAFEDYENAVKTYTGTAAQIAPQSPGRVLGLAEARLALGRELNESLGEVEPLLSEHVPVSMRARREVVYGQLLSAAGRHEDALKVLTAAEKQYREQAFDVQLALGFANRAAGQMDAAQRAYETAVKLAPKGRDDEAKEGLGRVMIARSREREMLSKLPREPDSRKVSLVRGIAYGRLGEWKNARSELQKTALNGKFPPESVVQLALADAAEDNSEKAIEVLKKLEATVKKSRAAVLVALARVYMQRNELDKAKGVLEEAAKDPADYEGNALLGELLVSLGLSELAVEPLTRAVERNGSHGPSRHLLGRVQLDLGRFPEGLKQAEAWVLDNPGSEEAERDLAFALYHSGRAKEAEGPIAKAVKGEPNHPEGQRIRAQVLFARGDAKAAINSLERANKLNPKDAETFCEIGHAMVRQGNTEVALKAYEAARANDPKAACGEVGPYHARPWGGMKAVKDLTEVKNKAPHSWDRALAYASLARVRLQANALKEARAAADDALVLSPFGAPAHYASGLVAMRQKEDAKALEELGKAAELDPSWGSARLAYADLLVRQGPEQLPRAIAEYEAFLVVSQAEPDSSRVKNDLKRLKKKLSN